MITMICLTVISTSPTSVAGAPALHGVGYRDPEIQDSGRRGDFNSLTSQTDGVLGVSYNGGLNILISGQELSTDAQKNFIVLKNSDQALSFNNEKFTLSMLSLEDTLYSNPMEGTLSFKLPSLATIMNLQDSDLYKH